MRKIKFRGKHVDYGEWLEGDLITYENGTVSIREPKTWFTQNVIPETVGQFTGLRDENGKEIYEGDIILTADGYVTAVVKIGSCYPEPVKKFCGLMGIREHSTYCLHAYDKDGEYLIEDNKTLEVIGNIYENPELMEEINNG